MYFMFGPSLRKSHFILCCVNESMLKQCMLSFFTSFQDVSKACLVVIVYDLDWTLMWSNQHKLVFSPSS